MNKIVRFLNRMVKKKLLIIIVLMALLIAGYLGYSQIFPPELLPGSGRIELLEQTPQWQSFIKTAKELDDYRGSKQDFLTIEGRYGDLIRRCQDTARDLELLINKGLISKIEVTLISRYFSDWSDNFDAIARQTCGRQRKDISKEEALRAYGYWLKCSYKTAKDILPSLKVIAQQDCTSTLWIIYRCLLSRGRLNELQKIVTYPELINDINYWMRPVVPEMVKKPFRKIADAFIDYYMNYWESVTPERAKKLFRDSDDAFDQIINKNIAQVVNPRYGYVFLVRIIQPDQNEPLELRRPKVDLLLKEISYVLTMPPKTSYAPLPSQPDFKLIIYYSPGGGRYPGDDTAERGHFWDLIMQNNWVTKSADTDVSIKTEFKREFEVYLDGTLLCDIKTNNLYDFRIDEIYRKMINRGR